MEFWRAVVQEKSGALVHFVSDRGYVREWIAWYLSRGAVWGTVSVSSGAVSSVEEFAVTVWRPVWHFSRQSSGDVVWQDLRYLQ